MFIFFAIACFGFIVLVGGSLFGGHDHDHSHDFGYGHDHIGGNEPTVSIFSMKVIGTFIMGFGATGTIAKYYKADTVLASVAGIGGGIILGFVMYLTLKVIYGQQSNSLVRTEETLNQIGVVTLGIDPGALGKVEVSIGDIRRIYMARSLGNTSFVKGDRVKVVDCHGSQLVVDTI